MNEEEAAVPGTPAEGGATVAGGPAPVAEGTGSEGEGEGGTEGAAPVAGAIEIPEPVETRTQVEVGLQRSVRYGPIIVVGIAVGAVISAVAALLFPVASDADYELGQVVGLMAVVGAAIGLVVGAILCLILGRIARRDSGAAIAVLTDVR